MWSQIFLSLKIYIFFLKKWKFFKFWSSYPIIMHVILNFRPFRSISYGFRDKHFFKFFIFLSLKFKKIKCFQILVFFPIIMHVIRYFRPFRSISYGFQDKHFFGHLTHYNGCDPKFLSVSLYLLRFPRWALFKKII